MNSLDYHNVFFIGIGGIGMSALARWFKANGQTVEGYDKTATGLTAQLIEEGIEVHYQDDITHIPQAFTKDNTLVVYTPAIPARHSQYTYFVDQGYVVKKRAEVLGLLSAGMFTVAVAGTHGKTTTSSMIAHILKSAGIDTTAFLGGIAVNYATNLLLAETSAAVAVIEADEYDRSFLQLAPDIEVITSVDADHLDSYGGEDEMLAAYQQFAGKLAAAGKCIVAAKAQDRLQVNGATVYGEGSRIYANNLRLAGGRYHFDYVKETQKISTIPLALPGRHNAENAVAAITVATSLGVGEAAIKKAFATYRGVKRRFEYVLELPEMVFIDDYAHHPAEVAGFIGALRELYPDKFIQVIFQPHLYSRTRDFAAEFAASLSQADSVILMDIYPAREAPIAGVTSALILERIRLADKALMTTEEILAMLPAKQPQVLATVGAGDIDKLVPQIKDVITKTMVK